MKNILIVVLSCLIVFLTCLNFHIRTRFQNRILQTTNYNKQRIGELYSDFNLSLKDVNKCLKYFQDELVDFSKVITANESRIIIRFPENYCTSCTDDYLDKFKELLDSIGLDQGVVLMNYDDKLQIKHLKVRHRDLESRIFNVKKISLELDNQKKPYVFTVGSDGRVSNILLLNKRFPESYLIYVKQMRNFFKNE